MIAGFRVVFMKELVDSVRDRRSLLSALLYPLLALLVGLLLAIFVSREAVSREIELPIAGQEQAPDLIAFLERHGVVVLAAPADPEAAIRRGDHQLVIEIPDEFANNLREGEPATVRIVVDQSLSGARRLSGHARELLEAYSRQFAAQRMMARGISPDIPKVIDVEERDLATPQEHAANVLNTIPLFLILAAFFGGMQVAIDTTAGERERGSLEALLTNPVPRLTFVLGKWATTVLFSVVSVFITMASCTIVMADVPLEELGLALKLSPALLARMLVTTIPVAFLAAAIQMLVASFARSFKEAQTYLSALLFVPMLPGLLLAIYPLETRPWMLAIPTLAQTQLLGDVMRGTTVETSSILIATGSTILFTALGIFATARLLQEETVVFGR
jgi:sodium transport system permease protein